MKMQDENGAAAAPMRCNRLVLLVVILLLTWSVPGQRSAGAEPSESAQELTRMWKDRQEEIAGWQDEKQGPTWKQYLSNQLDGADKLLMPKTIEAVLGTSYWLGMDTVKSDAEENKNDAAVKSTLAEAHKTLDEATAKLNEAFNNVLTEAEKDDTQAQNELARIKADDLRLAADAWFKDTPYHDRNLARAGKLKEKWAAMVASGEEAREAAATKLTAEASAAWPAIASSIKSQDGFTPDKLDAFKGKTIHLTGHNRLGSDFNSGEYDYAHEVNGMPVAGKFTRAVAAAVDQATKQTGHDLPGSDWDVFAVVEGPGRISQRTRSNGTVKVDGQDVGTVTAEGHQSVSCVVVRIFALHAGPVAVKSSAEAVSP
jgi:hypothetical protein